MDVQRARGRGHVAVRVQPGTKRLRRPVARRGLHRPQRREAGVDEVAGERVVGDQREVEQVLVGARQRVVAEPARRVQRPPGHRAPRRLVRARPRRPSGPERRAGGAGPPRAAAAAPGRPDRARRGRRPASKVAPIVPTGMRCTTRSGSPSPSATTASCAGSGQPACSAARSTAAGSRASPRSSSSTSAWRRVCTEPSRSGLLARVAGHRGVRETVDVGEDRLREHHQHPRVQRRLGQLDGGPPRHPSADAVRRLQRVERATRAVLGAPDRLVDAVVGQVDVAPEQIDELLQRRRRTLADQPSELTLERLVVLDDLGAHRGDDVLDDARQPGTQQVRHLGGHGRPRHLAAGSRPTALRCAARAHPASFTATGETRARSLRRNTHPADDMGRWSELWPGSGPRLRVAAGPQWTQAGKGREASV